MTASRITVRVRDRHVRSGVPRDAGACPLALAFAETTGLRCEVWPDLILLRAGPSGDDWLAILLPRDAADRVWAYDTGHGMGEFDVDLEFPEATCAP